MSAALDFLREQAVWAGKDWERLAAARSPYARCIDLCPAAEDNREATWESRAARWRPDQAREEHPVRSGRPPKMTLWPSGRIDRGTDIGRTEQGEYWRCRTARCRRWSGPYANPADAREDAAQHARLPHERTPPARGRGTP